MLTYWAMFVLPAGAALVATPTSKGAFGRSPMIWIVVWASITMLIGLRFEVGGDWVAYLDILNSVWGMDFHEVLTTSDPSYQVLNWLSTYFDWGIYGVNTLGAAFFTFGLIAFCLQQPNPWLALAISIPYLVIVVAMGYTRQSIALGLAMLALQSLANKSTWKFIFLAALAATFHKSAVLLLPIAALCSVRHRWWTIAWVGVATAVLYYVLLEKDIETLYANYVEAEYQSQGALIRLVMNAVPAAVLLIWRGRFNFDETEMRLWTVFAILSFVLLGIVLVSPATTAVDRVALYLLPLQVVVFAHLPKAFGVRPPLRSSSLATNGSKIVWPSAPVTFAVLVYYAFVQFVWLNYAATAFAWVPYQFYPLV